MAIENVNKSISVYDYSYEYRQRIREQALIKEKQKRNNKKQQSAPENQTAEDKASNEVVLPMNREKPAYLYDNYL